MDTTTRKQEALKLLALETMTDKQKWELDILTLKQVGWSIKKVRSGYYAAHNPSGEIDMGMDIFMSEDEGWVWVRKVHPFCTSVDACLALPLRGGYYWKFKSAVTGIPESHHEANIFNIHTPRELTISLEHVRGFKTMPIAMLWAWWHNQPD